MPAVAVSAGNSGIRVAFSTSRVLGRVMADNRTGRESVLQSHGL
jgi:hypothetical protein